MTRQPLSPAQRDFRRKLVVLFSALESVVESGIKLAAALYTGSAGLLADCIHSAADVAGSLMVWIGVRLAPHRFKRFPYGFYKIENLLALSIGFAILYGAYEILQIFLSGETVPLTNVPLGIAAVVLGMTLVFFWGRFEANAGRLLNSPGIEASGNHALADVYSSAVVLVGLVGTLLGFNLDRWAALFVCVVITKIGIEILWSNLMVLLDMALPRTKLDEYKKVVAAQPGVRSILGLRGRSAGSFRFVDVEVGIKAFSVEQASAIASAIEEGLKARDESIDRVFVHYLHELPAVLCIVVPTDETGELISDYFGKASHLTRIRYDRASKVVVDRETTLNAYQQDEKHRGIQLADALIGQGVDSVCCREDLSDKGPGLMFHRFGVEVRKTDCVSVHDLLVDYIGNSHATYAHDLNRSEHVVGA